MTRRFALILLVVLAACSSRKAVERPPLDKQKMVAVLVDIHLLEAQQQAKPFEKARVYNALVGYEKIFLKHGVTDQQFNESFAYYREHPQEMDDLYQAVIDEATRRESEISSAAAKERLQRPVSGADTAKPKPGYTPAPNEW